MCKEEDCVDNCHNHHYLMDGSKNSVTQELYLTQLCGLQEPSVDFSSFLSRIQRLKTL